MSYIPDSRTDEYYSEKYLGPNQKKFADGYDAATEDGQSFFDNLDVFDLEVDVRPSDISAVADALSEAFKIWMEGQRNVCVVSMIDSLSEEEYKANVEAARKEEHEQKEGKEADH